MPMHPATERATSSAHARAPAGRARAGSRAKTAAAIANAIRLRKRLFWNVLTGAPTSSHSRTKKAIAAKPNALATMQRIPL